MKKYFSKNKRLVFYLAFFFMMNCVVAQKVYFQQRVDYVMQVKLNDHNHSLSAQETIHYLNNSDVELSEIYFHLWPNAYKNKSTALAKQLLLSGETSLFDSEANERGYIDSLDFVVNGQKVNWVYDSINQDICKLILNEPLKAGDSILITTPFYLKIPEAKFSRLGHEKQAYYITQWYPKPAVFDNEGWHPMPYLNQGEFYSEFGSFDVRITLPKNYVLVATGDRIDAPEEELFLEKRANESKKHLVNNTQFYFNSDFPSSSDTLKTVRFSQSNVHDFAWFADKRFYVVHDKIDLHGKNRTINSWVFFLEKNKYLWKNAIDYVNSATQFYSLFLGEYPYNHVSAIDGNITAGGGMEYPNITVIGEAGTDVELDMVMTHEIGHNWFYGILANNERESPFMDEGLNSFYEMRYMRAKYPKKKLTALIGRDTSFKLFGASKIPLWKLHEIAFYPSLRAHTDQAIFLKAIDFNETNYGSCVYSKSALVMDYLMEYMGEKNFDAAMRSFYETYKFKHPTSNDLFRSLSESSGLDLNRIKYHLFQTNDNIDFKIKKIKKQEDGSFNLTLKNKTRVLLPFNISTFKNNQSVNVKWFDAFESNRTVNIVGGDYDKIKIDGTDKLPDIQRKNNSISTKGLFKKKEKLDLNFLTGFEDPQKSTFHYLPIGGGNFYNGAELGIAVHNVGFSQKKFEYIVAPMFAFNTRNVVGFAEFNFNFYPKKVIQLIEVGAKFKSFAYDYYDTRTTNQNLGTSFENLYLNYYKVAPYIKFELKKKDPKSQVSHFITLTNSNLFTDSIDYTVYQTFAVSGPHKKNVYSFVNQVSYDIIHKRTIDPYTFHLELQHTATMAKLSAVLNYNWRITKHHTAEIRLFAGTFIAGNEEERGYYAFRGSGYNGWHDYLFETNFAARNERNGFGFSQFTEKDGALNVWTPLAQSPYWMTSLNVKSPKLFKLPIKIFADVLITDARVLDKDLVLWDAGINIAIWKNIIDIYIPLVYSKDIKNTLELNQVDFVHSIRFTFNIHKLAPKSIIQNSLF